MAAPALELSTASPLTTTAEVLLLGIRKGADGPELATDDPAFADLATALPALGATGALEELHRVPPVAGGSAGIALVGLGADPDADALRAAAGSATRKLTGVDRLAIALPASTPAEIGAVLEGAGIGAYSYTGYRVTTLGTTKTAADHITVHVDTDADAALTRARAVVEAMHAVRDLVNTPPSDLYPETLAAAAVDHAAGLPIEVEVLDEKALAEGGYGGILGVGAGSTRPPRLVVLRYAPKGAATHLSLVGKGITFDSGGLSLKPPSGMVGMKYDMTGSVTVLAVLVAIARLGLPVQVTARMCIAENLPSGSAMRPNDVLRMRGGSTVEVLNTDAEGRLVLADGLVDASAEQPDVIIDVATLTGAARAALGERVAPVLGDPDLCRRLVDATAGTGEQMWHMPMPAEMRAVLDSDVADIANARPGQPTGGMIVAAHFLKTFIGRRGDAPDAPQIPWAHLDIAGVANNTGSPFGPIGKGTTGATVRTLIAFAESLAAGPDASAAE